MRKTLILVLPLLAAACGGSDTQEAEAKLCGEVSKLALGSPDGFAVAEYEAEETSEGETFRLQVEYDTTGGIRKATRTRCWFKGYGENRQLAEFSYETEQGFETVSKDALEKLREQASARG